MRRTIAVLAFFFATAALASWYDDYDAGLNAARKGQWNTVIQKMTAAINGNAKENDKARTYGAIFISYHPYYYRGIAYLNTGKFEQAIADLERAEGIGDENLGSIEINMGRAKQKLAAANAPEPQPAAPQPAAPQPRAVTPVPQPVQPAAPAIDPALRQQAAAALNEAKNHLTAAQQRKAGGSPQYSQAAQQFASASTLNAGAKSNDDLRQVISTAQSAASIADLAVAPGAPAVAVAAPTPTRPVAASSMVLGDTARRVRLALEKYFDGDFEEAAGAFQRLTTEMPRNGWIYAFLGASQYSQYAFEADEKYKQQALDSFRKAKQYGKWKKGLPEKYFSRRIRRAFDTAG